MNPESWEILNLDPSASIEKIRKRFRKLVLKHHPDKGGSPFIFDKIKNAYKDILLFHTGLNQKHHFELKQQAKQHNVSQSNQQYRGQLDPNNLNLDQFNRFFETHRLEDPLENGYGHLMAKSGTREDDSLVVKQKISSFPEQQLVLHKEPEEVFTYRGAVTLLGDKPKNFTTAWNDRVKYTDYMEAHSKPIDRDSIPIRESYRSLDELQHNRDQPIKLTKEEIQRQKKIEKERERREYKRLVALNKQDKKRTMHYQKLQNLLGL